jgi:hypothetical protein
MAAMERLWTVKDVMEVIPLGKTSCVAIINSLPHINLGGKLMIDPQYIRTWIARNTKPGTAASPSPAPKKPKPRKIPGLTEDGLIPYRHSKKGA